MLDKNDRRYIIRRIITYIAIAMIMFVISSCQAKALTTTATISDIGNSININQNEYTKNYYFTNGISQRPIFENGGEGNLIFSLGTHNSSSPVDQITQVSVGNNTNIFVCDIGTATTYVDSGFQRIIYSVNCPVNINSEGIRYVTIQREDYYGTLQVYIGQYATFVSKDNVNVTVDQQAVTNAINQSTQQMIQQQQSTQQAINDMNNNITDSTPPSSSEISGNTSDWNNYNASNGVINDLVLMPVTLLNSFVNGMNNSCSSYDLGELWGEHIILPCINLSQMLGSVWSIIDIILSGVFIFVFGKQCVKIFNDFTNLRSGQIDTLYGGGN